MAKGAGTGMPGDVRGDAPHGGARDSLSEGDQSARSEQRASWHWVLTLRIDNGLPQLADLANIFSAVVRVYVKLVLLRDQSPASVMEYATHPSPHLTQNNSPTVIRITMNSPVTLVLSVSESVGKALASLIDAVSQARIRYDKAKLELKRTEVALARDDAEWELRQAMHELALTKQADEHRAAMQERAFELQARAEALRTQERKTQDAEVTAMLHMRTHITDTCLQTLAQLHPSASEEMKQVLAKAFLQDLLELAEYGSKLTVESMKPLKPA